MRIISFEISDFKGINRTKIDISNQSGGNIGTLIGLNESGKTTILEAISHFVTQDKYALSLISEKNHNSAVHDLIPKHKKAAFSGRVIISAKIELNDGDINSLSNFFLNEHNLYLDKDKIPRIFALERVYLFEDSTHKSTDTLWGLTFFLKSKKERTHKHHGSAKENEEERRIWLSGVDFLRNRIPKVVYFPDFLFDFPDRIYLSETSDNTNQYYQQIIQDIFDNNSQNLSIQKHILDRIERLKLKHSNPKTFTSFLFSSDEKRQIDAVIQSLSNEIGKIIFGSWSEVLGRNVTGKRIQIDWFLDYERENAPYIELSIFDGQDRYSLSERSLGFRWFFSFLLFTQFRQNRKENRQTIFLFDEPASNLHARAQMKLLETFAKIASEDIYIMYSTHSHYMINPIWLDNAYIVQNKGTDYERDNEFEDFQLVKTDIQAIKYKTFVGRNPTKTTYFQPVLDALDVSISPLISAKNAIIIEGKYDYYAMAYFIEKMNLKGAPPIFPCSGAGHMATLISLFRGWGVDFRIILDDDHAGRREKKRYIKDMLVLDKEIFTIGEITSNLKSKAFESLYMEDVKNEIRDYFSISDLTKQHYCLFFQKKLSEKSTDRYPETEAIFSEIGKWIEAQFLLESPRA